MNLLQRWKKTTVANQLMVLTTAVVAFGTLFYVLVAIFQYCLMKESARQASEQTDKLIAETKRMADITVEALNEAKRSNVETANRAERAIQTSRAFADAATSQAETSKKSATAAESSAITAKEVLQFEQSKGKAQLEVKVRRTFSKTVTIAARASVSISETLIGADGKIKEHVPFHGDDSDNKVPPLNGASQDVLTEIILLFRNLSYRPTAVIDVYVEREGIIGGRGYKGRIKPLPFQLEPWGIKEISFKIDKEDEKNDTKIMIIDIDDNKLEEDFVNLGARWTRMTEKRITMPIDGIIVEPERH